MLLVASVMFAPAAARSQDVFPGAPADRMAVTVATFRTAIVHGQLTAHGDAVPDVLCLAQMVAAATSAPLRDRLLDPDSAVVALLRERMPNVRPMSACRIEPRRGPRDNTSLVVEQKTGKRGLVIWAEPPERDSKGAIITHIGYYEHGLSAADWVCAVRRINDEWVVNACRMKGIS